MQKGAAMQRRKHTIKKNIRLTQETHDAIDAWATAQGVSFSAALETLTRTALDQEPTATLAPVLVSALRRELAGTYDRLIRLLLYTIAEAGTTQRLAGATLRHLRPDKYDQIKAHAIKDSRRSLARARIGALIEELYGDREGELRHTRGDDGEGGEGGE